MTYRTKTPPMGWGVRIMVRDIAGREPLTTAVDRAKLPAATSGGVAYVRTNDVDPAMVATRYDIRLHHGGADTLLTSGTMETTAGVSAMCASDTLLAWAVHPPRPLTDTPASHSTGGRLHVMNLATKVQQTIALNDDAGGLGTMLGWTLPPKGAEAAQWRVTKWHG